MPPPALHLRFIHNSNATDKFSHHPLGTHVIPSGCFLAFCFFMTIPASFLRLIPSIFSQELVYTLQCIFGCALFSDTPKHSCSHLSRWFLALHYLLIILSICGLAFISSTISCSWIFFWQTPRNPCSLCRVDFWPCIISCLFSLVFVLHYFLIILASLEYLIIVSLRTLIWFVPSAPSPL